MNLFDTYNIGNMWYVGIQNNQRAFAIFDSETGWNNVVLDKLTGVQPTKWPSINQVINGEFVDQSDQAWKVTTDQIHKQVVTQGAYSGSTMLKLTVPDLKGSDGQLYLQTYTGSDDFAPGRTLLHLIQGNSYKIRFIAGTDADQQGRLKVRLRDVSDERVIEEFNWINVSAGPTTNVISYKHRAASEMNVRLEFDVGSIKQVLYLDSIELIRDEDDSPAWGRQVIEYYV